jgi:hypothetical protein
VYFSITASTSFLLIFNEFAIIETGILFSCHSKITSIFCFSIPLFSAAVSRPFSSCSCIDSLAMLYQVSFRIQIHRLSFDRHIPHENSLRIIIFKMKVKQAPFYHSCICQYKISGFIKIIFRKIHFLISNSIIHNILK